MHWENSLFKEIRLMRMIRTFWTLYVLTSCLLCVTISIAFADVLTLNEDGYNLIQQAREAYDSDMDDRPVVTDPAIRNYVQKVAEDLLFQGNPVAKGVQLSVTVIDSPKPEVYTYIDGHLVLSSGLVYGLDNEAQLAGVLASQMAHLSEGYYRRSTSKSRQQNANSSVQLLPVLFLAHCWTRP